MIQFPIHTLETAPEQSKPGLESMQAAFGFLPNIAGAIANSPVLIDCLVGLFGKVHGGSFSEPQIQVLLLTNAVTNASAWAAAFHSHIALEQGISQEDVAAIRRGGAPKDAKVAALSILAKTLIEKRGHLDDEDLQHFTDAGFSRELALEVVAVVAASTITNYAGTLASPPLEETFQPHQWSA